VSGRLGWTVAGLVGAALVAFVLYAVVAGLSGTSVASEAENAPATAEAIGHTGLHRLVLSERAMQRVGIRVAPVERVVVAGQRRVAVPYSAILYDADGRTWAYTNPAPRTFVRHRVAVQRVRGGAAILTRGPPLGTRVVTVGAAELFGTEFEFAED